MVKSLQPKETSPYAKICYAIAVGIFIVCTFTSIKSGLIQNKSNVDSCDTKGDKVVLAVMIPAKANLELARTIDFYFYGSTDHLSKLRAGLVELGLSVRATNVGSGLIGTTTAVVNEQWFKTMTPRMCDL